MLHYFETGDSNATQWFYDDLKWWNECQWDILCALRGGQIRSKDNGCIQVHSKTSASRSLRGQSQTWHLFADGVWTLDLPPPVYAHFQFPSQARTCHTTNNGTDWRWWAKNSPEILTWHFSTFGEYLSNTTVAISTARVDKNVWAPRMWNRRMCVKGWTQDS